MPDAPTPVEPSPVDGDGADTRPIPPAPRVVSSVALTSLLVLAALYVSTFMVPVVIGLILAAILKLMLSPLVEAMRRMGVPRILTSLGLVVSLVALVSYAIVLLMHPIAGWLDEAPRTLHRIERQLLPVLSPLQDVRSAADTLESLTTAAASAGEQPEVRVAAADPLQRISAGLPSLLLGLTVTIFVTFFLLGSGDAFLRKLASTGHSFSDRRRIVTMVQQIQADVGKYLRTITLINIMLGVATGGLLAVLDVPNPLVWGTVAALSNFAPYVGPLMMIAALTLSGLAHSEALGGAIIAPACFAALTTVEGQMITPAVLGHRMSMSPLVVFVGVVIAGWLWGLAGALVAVPVLVTVKIVCQHVPEWQLVALLMAADSSVATGRV
jgi:predicted PurR-regulated permease PerM